jgi:hypothetical protein
MLYGSVGFIVASGVGKHPETADRNAQGSWRNIEGHDFFSPQPTRNLSLNKTKPIFMEQNQTPQAVGTGDTSASKPAPRPAKPVAAKTAGAEKPVAAGAEKPAKAAAPKKEERPPEPLVDNGNGTVTDPNTGLMWKKSDAWIDAKKFYTWAKHKEYVDKVNKDKFAGFSDWRIPSKAEAVSIFNKDKQCLDKNGIVYFVDPIFEAGGASSAWISECTDAQIVRFDFKTGVETPYPGKDIWASMRLVRKAK